MTCSPPLRLLVAGAGIIGRSHIDLVRTHPACVLDAIVDPTPAAAELARTLAVPHFADLDEALARRRPDGAILATPNGLHVPQALSCLAQGVAALVEKPLAPTVAEGERLCQTVEAAQAQGRPARLLVGHHRAHSPILARARELIAQGQLGQIVAVTGSALFFKPDAYFAEGPWRCVDGGGPILINLIHEVGNLRSLCGEVSSVQAMASHATRGFAVEDTAVIGLRFASGALGSFVLSDTAASARSWEQTSQENKAYDSHADEDCYLIAGTRGSLAVPTMRLKTYASDEDRSWWLPFDCSVATVQRHDPLAAQLAHFIEVVQGRTLPLVSARDGLQNLRVVEAIAQAVRSGGVVTL